SATGAGCYRAPCHAAHRLPGRDMQRIEDPMCGHLALAVAAESANPQRAAGNDALAQPTDRFSTPFIAVGASKHVHPDPPPKRSARRITSRRVVSRKMCECRSAEAGEVKKHSVEGEGDRVGTLHSRAPCYP